MADAAGGAGAVTSAAVCAALDSCDRIDEGHTAWMLVATGFVLLMTPGLAFFEAGLLRSRNSISILMQCWAGLLILSTLWYIVGYTLALGPSAGDAGIIGNLDHFFFIDVETNDAGEHINAGGIPLTVFATFQMMFAVITPLLITGAFSERVEFGAFVVFIILWSVIIYYPVCHWVWGGGWLTKLGGDENGGAVDFAGGIVIHTTAGISSLVVALVLGPRKGFDPSSTSWNTEARPHSIPLATIGAAMLWMGWFGFNAGSALASGATPGHTLLCTHIGACTCGIVWTVMSKIEDGKPSIVASLNGAIAGLAGITPASGFITSQSSFFLGIVLGFASYYSVKLLKGRLLIDDALDVSSVHGCTGIVGSLAVGFIGDRARVTGAAGADIYGLFFGGGWHLLLWQTIAVAVAAAWAALWTWLICKFLEKTTGFRVSEEQEDEGLDAALHGETARILDMSPNAVSPRKGPLTGKVAVVDQLGLDDAPKPEPKEANETAVASA